MIKNVVFDIGAVLVDYRLMEFLMEKGFDGAMIKRIIKASIMSPYWDEFDRGALTEEEALEAFASIDPEIKDELYKAYNKINGMLLPRDYAIPWVQALKAAGYGVYYLSNYSKKAYEECSDSLSFMPYTDGGILSFRELIVKPDPEIYKRLLERFDLKAEECVFVDDTAKNVEVAESLGFEGIVFKSYEETVEKLANLGVVTQ